MFGWKVSAVVSAIFFGSSLSAQTAARPLDPVFARAQMLVSDGNGPAGRALIDSMIAATPPSAPLYPQALFWRASLAASAADAESDYKHIVVDYPLTPQAPEALLRLAQLELARGDRDAALGHLQRIPRDYPGSKSLARANYWIARVFFEKNDLAKGCAANASALAQLDTNEVELRNQVQYQRQRCPSVDAVSALTRSQAAAVASVATDSIAVATEKPVDTGRATPSPETTKAKPATADLGKAPTAKSEQSTQYSVQVAAYKTQAEAEKLASNLKKSGYEARVDVSPDWFRVRVGRYATESAAEAQLREMKARQMSGFIVRAPDR